MDEESPTNDMDGDDDYWKFMEKPVYDMSREGSVHLGTWGGLGMKVEHSEFSYDHSVGHRADLGSYAFIFAPTNRPTMLALLATTYE